jgi:RNA methyltransferase, TrmH family
MPEPITSPSNPRIKDIIKLQGSSRERRSREVMIVEGYREISRAHRSGFRFIELFVCTELDRQGRGEEFVREITGLRITEVSSAAFARIAYREGSDGLIGIAESKKDRLDDLVLSDSPLILVLEAVEKPGNLGALMRTADAAAVDAVIICDPLTDLYNPNVIRSSVGCIFSRKIVACSTAEAIDWLRKKGIRIFSAALVDNARPYHQADFRGPSAIVMGTEATGLSREWLDQSDETVIIPMRGIADSLNVSTSAAVLVFEAVRQRERV